jgi:Spy/CpxP family protein refolding chaperone
MSRQIFIGLLLITLASSVVVAKSNGQKGPARGAGHDPVERLTEALQLDEDQSARLSKIFSNAHEQHTSLQSAERDEHCAIREQTDTQIAEILSNEQYARFEELREERGQRHPRGGSRGKFAGHGKTRAEGQEGSEGHNSDQDLNGGEGMRPGPHNCS